MTAALGVELDCIDAVCFAGTRGTVTVDDAVWVRPCDSRQGCNKIAVRHRTLNGVIELGDVLEEITHITPGSTRGGPAWVSSRCGYDEVEDGPGYRRVGNPRSEFRWCRHHEIQFPIAKGGFLHFQGTDVFHTDILEISEFLDLVERIRAAVSGCQDFYFRFLERLCHLGRRIQLQSCIKRRIKLHVEELLVVGLEDVGKNLG